LPALDLAQPLFEMPAFELGADPPLLSYLTAPLPVRVQSDSLAVSRPRHLVGSNGSLSGDDMVAAAVAVSALPNPARSSSDPVDLIMPVTDDESMNFAMFELAAMRLLDDPLDAPSHHRSPPGLAPPHLFVQPKQLQPQQHHHTTVGHPLRQHSGPQQSAVLQAHHLQQHLLQQQHQHQQHQQLQQQHHQHHQQHHQPQQHLHLRSASPVQGDDDDDGGDDDDDDGAAGSSGSPVKTKRRRPGKRQRERRKAARAAAAAAAAAAETIIPSPDSPVFAPLQQQTLSTAGSAQFSSMLGQPYAPLLQRTTRELLDLEEAQH
jgi:hypothetical protein